MILKNQVFSHSSLARCLYQADFFNDEQLHQNDYREEIINSALLISDSLFESGISLKEIKANGKKGFTTSSLPEKLTLRRCCQNLKACFSVKMKNRDIIAKEIISHLKEGTPYRIYRLDIKSFFESIALNSVFSIVDRNDFLSFHTKNLVKTYLHHFEKLNNPGIPRGVEISPVIAEILLREFDCKIKSDVDIFYYVRFVDDILIITSSQENEHVFLDEVRNSLPTGLSINESKQKKSIISVDKQNKAGNVVAEFNFLGYEYIVRNRNKAEKVLLRDVVVDLSKSKKSKIKEKISKSFYSYVKNGDFFLLNDRIVFLTTNRDFKHQEKKKNIPTGIYYNYSKITTKDGLENLDAFVKSILFGHCGRLGKLVKASLSNEQKRVLLKISFKDGHEKCIYKRFSPNRLREIVSIWK
ncbi:MAG: antiviral reverse transcriptase Drt3a [Thiolinea sp.]